MLRFLFVSHQIKCDQYWPGRGVENYGLMQVLLVDVTELSTYTIRTFHISRVGQAIKKVTQVFFYINDREIYPIHVIHKICLPFRCT